MLRYVFRYVLKTGVAACFQEHLIGLWVVGGHIHTFRVHHVPSTGKATIFVLSLRGSQLSTCHEIGCVIIRVFELPNYRIVKKP